MTLVIKMGKCVSVEKKERSNTEPPVLQRAPTYRRGSKAIFERQPTIKPTLRLKVVAEAKNAQISTEPPSTKVYQELFAILKEHYLFTMMSEEIIKFLVKKMKTYVLAAEELVYKQGDIGMNFFVVLKGSLDVQFNGESVSTLRVNSCFGELGLIQDKPRDSTVVTLEKTTLKGIDRSSYREGLTSINEKKHSENLSFIESVPFFQKLTKEQLQVLLGVIVTQKFTEGQHIITEGETGDLFYIIKEGTVHCTKKGTFVRDFHSGEWFGEQALLYQSKRKATITAAGKVVVISIDRDNLIKALGQKLDKLVYQNTLRISFGQSSYLKNLNMQQIDMIIDKMELKKFSSGEVLPAQGTLKGEILYVVVNGEFGCGENKYRLYDMIGDEELRVEGIKRNFRNDLTALENSEIAMITRKDFETIICGDLKSVLHKNNLIEVLKNVTIFRILPLSKLQQIINVLKNQDFAPGEHIFKQNSAGDKFYIVKEGSVEILKDGVSIRTVEANGYFGERSIILEELRTATAVAKVLTKCWILEKSNFISLIDSKILNDLLNRIQLQNDSIGLSDLIYLKTLQDGIFGHNFLCMHSGTNVFYTLNAISRSSIELFNAFSNLISERKIMKSIDHPLVSKMIRTFKDPQRVYFLIEHVKGKDLFDVIREIDINNESARFYAAGILIIFEYLHSHNIMYRDLKPENILIDESGYPKISDFGNAKVVESRTYSTVGTPHYMAPEVISGKGYTLAADYWSLGVVIYELLFNKLPFSTDETDTVIIYQSILQNPLTYPSGNHLAKPILDQLLFKNPTMRGNYRTIKEHPWFIGINWDSYLAKEIKPPYKPKVDGYEKEINAASKIKNKNAELINRILVKFI